ncbi:VOC family protein [Paeniglutamicibacter sp. ZC-3]|uniref:VOC family protein n=1 Tax=Paeniglutamicibacter sp. ZC-3 TaxID=2986919 RepID=UPI0021F7E55B|nr:VOC family protein [Paeniglutamicibacter sp. ZC-3]MCV9994223.1 VOC family protein [Paeniglutamicibacter sp. ZC-3]
MPKPELTVGAPCWIDLLTSAPEKSQAFYTELFGWTYEAGDAELYGGYITASKDGKMVAGIMNNDGTSGSPDVWTTYLRVDDIDAATKAAAEHGGQVYLPPMEVPEQGKMAMFGDAGGAAVGIWEFGGHTGYEVAAENGAPAWHELFTRDFAPTVKFYEDVFGWDTAVVGDTDEFRYTTLGAGDDSKAGIMDASSFLPAGAPASWHVYFAVENADAIIEKTLALGGEVIQPAEDTPFGRNAALKDPTGAEFWITQDIGQG